MTNRTYGRILIFSAAALLFVGGTALAQAQQPGGMGQQQQQQQQQQPGQIPGQPGQIPGATGTTASTEASLADQAFVSSIFESDATQEHLGQLAQQKSESPDVKQLGQLMMENRSKLDEQLKPVAQKMDVRVPKKPSKKEKELMAKLEALSGPQFDEEYIKAVAKGNEQDVKNFQTEAESAADPTLQLAAKQDATVLAAHQQAVEKIAQSHNVAMDEKK
jgi:putative membrane protein